MYPSDLKVSPGLEGRFKGQVLAQHTWGPGFHSSIDNTPSNSFLGPFYKHATPSQSSRGQCYPQQAQILNCTAFPVCYPSDWSNFRCSCEIGLCSCVAGLLTDKCIVPSGGIHPFWGKANKRSSLAQILTVLSLCLVQPQESPIYCTEVKPGGAPKHPVS